MTPDLEAKRRRHRNERIVATVGCLLVAALVFVFIRWNQSEEEKLRAQTTYVPKKERITPEILLLRDYVRIDTTPGRELAGARWIVALLAKHGVIAELIESGPGRANVYARIRGKRSDDGLLLLQHIDVVPPGDGKWSHPPFAAEIKYNMLYGRGALDMKSIGLCQILAFLDVARSGKAPERDLVLLAVADEENGGRYGMEWLLDHRPEIFAGVRYALNEGGVTEMQAEEMDYFGIEIGTKQSVELRMEGTQEQLFRARHALEPRFEYREPQRILPEVRAFLRDLAPTRPEFGPMLANLDETIAAGRFWELPKGYRELTQNIAWAENPANGAMRVLLINLPDQDPDAVIADVEALVAGTGVRTTVVRKDLVTPLSATDTALFRLIAAEARRIYGSPAGRMILHGSNNDSRFLRRRGIVAYGLSPFPMDSFQSASIHQNDERIRLDWFMQGVELTGRVVGKFATTP